MTKPPSLPLFPRLPPHAAKDPRLLRWDVARTQAVVQSHAERIETVEARIEAVENRPHLPDMDAPSWLRLAAIVACIGLFLTGLLSREEAKQIGLKLFGVLFGG